jgi:acyl-[acyl-carrier-protein]-phospholipid O-acyltransferase / long-chain-fatty-acid--[acyl-carrier-protein] ligase
MIPGWLLMQELITYWPWLFLFPPTLLGLLWLFPITILKPIFSLIVRLSYRFRVFHADRIPQSGGVLIVANHVTYIDWILLGLASPRVAKYVIYEAFYRNPILRFLLSFGRGITIRIDSRSGRPHAALDALRKVVNALDAGEVVVIYPEGGISRSGAMLPWGRGVEWILKHCTQPVSVIPAHLDNLWGTAFSWEGGRLFWKWPKDFRRVVSVYFGQPQPITATAAELRFAVQECNAECGILLSDDLLPVHRVFVRNACRWGNIFRVMMIDNATGSERKLTFGKSLVGAWSLRDWLASRIGTEQNIGIWMPTSLGSLLTNMAVLFLKRTTVNLNYTSGPEPVASCIEQAGIKTVITSARFLHKVPMNFPEGVRVIHLEEAMAQITGRERLLKFLAVLLLPGWFIDRVILGLHATKPDDLLTILFSSGSTGEPKGVMLSHRNIAGNVESFRRSVDFTTQDKMLCSLPYFHTFGYTVCLFAPVVVAMEMVFFPDPRSAKEIGETCKKYRCSILLGTATFLRFYMRRAEPDDFKTLRLIVCGAEKLPVQLAEDFEKRFGILPFEGYGCTELSPVVSVNLPDKTVAGQKQVCNRMGTIGQPIIHVAVKTFDPDTYEPLPFGTEGLLGAKGPNVMVGYLNQPEKSKQVLRDGWYVTGDIGRVEPDGFLRITGRVSRFAKIAGEMVPLERLDDEMHEILQTAGERVLAVAAVPDDKRGERVVVLHLEHVTEQLNGVFQQLRDRGLPNLWIPDHRDCYLVEQFPVLATGKLDLRRIGEVAKTIVQGKHSSVTSGS